MATMMEEEQDQSLVMYKQKDLIAALGIPEWKFYEHRNNGRLQGGVRDGRVFMYTTEELERFREELANPLKENLSKEKDETQTTPSPLEQEIGEQQQVVSLFLEHPQVFDPIEQAIALLQQTKQHGFDRQQMVQDVRAMRAQFGDLLQTMDDFLERYS